jgi:hypothetical protein
MARICRSHTVQTDPVQDDSDISSSYTPLPTRTKSGRNVNKPVAFVPTIPEPTQTVKRRRSTKTILAAQCRTCHRGTDPTNNRIVFCDGCNMAYHQYCHDPPISDEVVTVLEKEWLCGPCERSKQTVIEGTDGLVTAEGLSIDEVSLPKLFANVANDSETRIFLFPPTGAFSISPSPRLNTTPRTAYLSTQCSRTDSRPIRIILETINTQASFTATINSKTTERPGLNKRHSALPAAYESKWFRYRSFRSSAPRRDG